MSTTPTRNLPPYLQALVDAARTAMLDFEDALACFTIATDGGRKVGTIRGGPALSRAFDRASDAVVQLEKSILCRSARPAANGKRLGEPFDAGETFRECEVDLDAYSPDLWAAVEVLDAVFAWPADRLAEETETCDHARAAGRLHQPDRFRFGDVLSAAEVESIAACRRALDRAEKKEIVAPVPTGGTTLSDRHRRAIQALAWIQANHPDARTLTERARWLRECPIYDGLKRPSIRSVERYAREVRRMLPKQST